MKATDWAIGFFILFALIALAFMAVLPQVIALAWVLVVAQVGSMLREWWAQRHET